MQAAGPGQAFSSTTRWVFTSMLSKMGGFVVAATVLGSEGARKALAMVSREGCACDSGRWSNDDWREGRLQ